MNDLEPQHVRRVRYKGKNPRTFAEKYKEHNPESYAADMEKVIQRGQTPAGTHRPICVTEIMLALRVAPGHVGVDATLGYGGHSVEILKRIQPGGRLYALDVDSIELPRTEARLRALGYGPETLTIRQMNFAGIAKIAAESGPLNFVLADLGVSSMQIDTPARGFSYKTEGPLDLRLNSARGKPAAEFLLGLNKSDLEDLLIENSDEPHARQIAEAVHAKIHTGDHIQTTSQLRNTIADALGFLPMQERMDEIKKSCQRSFQALRIAVNNEFVVLDQFLAQLPHVLAPGGRVAILSFHSGEDRRVKQSFRELFRAGIYREVAPDPIRASAEECRSNSRASSAKLRWAIKGGDPVY
jgi:16S rRNA (cytosine1402-N4)-methyltransferase